MTFDLDAHAGAIERDGYTIIEDFMGAAQGRPVILNLGALPAWMLQSKEPLRYPEDPDQFDLVYSHGTGRERVTAKTIALSAPRATENSHYVDTLDEARELLKRLMAK